MVLLKDNVHIQMYNIQLSFTSLIEKICQKYETWIRLLMGNFTGAENMPVCQKKVLTQKLATDTQQLTADLTV